MFWLLRALAIIGLIFFFSPVRMQSDGREAGALDGARDLAKRAAPQLERAGELAHTWEKLPVEDRQRLLERFSEAFGAAGRESPAK